MITCLFFIKKIVWVKLLANIFPNLKTQCQIFKAGEKNVKYIRIFITSFRTLFQSDFKKAKENWLRSLRSEVESDFKIHGTKYL